MKTTDEKLVIHFINNGRTLFYSKLTSVPLREDAVLRLSEEFFGDPEPCMIHRSAVMNRMYMELSEYFLNNMNCEKSTFSQAVLPERLVSFIDVGGYGMIIVEKTPNA
jgi:hypothetical protein